MFDKTTLLLAEGSPFGPLGNLLPFILMIGVFYFLVLRPMKKQEDTRKQRLAELKRGDQVVLTGGILGRISKVEDDVVVVEIAEKVKIRVLKKDIADLAENALKKDGDKKDGDKKDGDKSAEKKDDKPAASDGDEDRKAG